MSPLRMGSASVPAVSAEALAQRSAALATALQLGGAQLDPGASALATAVVDKVRARTALVGGRTVVALAGATGSGKSSLFNAFVGADVATVGARRPTTSTPLAAVWGPEPAVALLDWLGVATRHLVASSPEPQLGSLDGLVLLDLPDFDSRVEAHRRESERMLGLVDVFVWVTDPQKYADARLHDDFVAALATHETVTLVVLNQTDRLGPAEIEACRADLKRLLEADGLPTVPVLATSATTGAGVPELRQRIANVVVGHGAARARLAADLQVSVDALMTGMAQSERMVDAAGQQDLIDALAGAAGVPAVINAVERDQLREATSRTGWPLTRWIASLRPRPLRRLRLDDGRRAVTDSDVRAVLGRSSLPPPSPAARAAVDLATRHLGDDAGDGLPPRWADAVAEAAAPGDADLLDALDQSVVHTSLRTRDPLWWSIVGILQMVFLALAVIGLAWLVVLAVLEWLQLPTIESPRVGPFAVPFVFLVGGLVLGPVLALLSRGPARLGARRRARVVEKRLRSAVAGVAEERIVGPVNAVLERHAATREALDTARG